MHVGTEAKANAVAPTALFLRADKTIPNNPSLPVVIYRQVFDSLTADKHKLLQHCFEKAGWKGVWKNGLYDYHHFHPSSHEVLGIARGSAELLLGGDDGKAVSLDPGDVIVLPAGTGHKRLASGNLVVIGAYPAGQENYAVCRSKGEAGADVATVIARVPLPTSDPVYGVGGPLLQIWSS